MKTIIAGGRDYFLTENDYSFLNTLKITEVVSGKATGADSCGENWAKLKEIPVIEFPADWEKFGKLAGPIRNKKMAEYSEQVVLFKGGRGTQSMFDEASKAGCIIHDRRCAVMWRKIDKYCMTNGTHNICKVTVNGKLTYELWIKGGERLGIYNSFDEAKGSI